VDIDTLLARAEMLLCYLGRDEALAQLIETGADPELAYFAVCAAGVR